MGSKFTEKYKRRSLLFFLLLLFEGRTKYVTIALLVVATSLPFMASTETIERMLELPPVASFLKAVGLGGVISAINPAYSTAGVKAALDKAAQSSRRESFWNKFLNAINSTLPPAGSPSSMAMVRGGGDIFGPPVIKDQKSAGPVKGVVNAEERMRGEDGGAVNLEGLLAGAGDGGAVFGDLMGQSLGESYGSGPYVNTTLTSKGGVVSQREGIYDRAMNQAGSKIPVPGNPQRVRGRKMGRVDGFTWKNVGYRTRNASVNVFSRGTSPLFQLAATHSMTESISRSLNPSYEYQAAYDGATYDGNNVNLNAIETGGDVPNVPDTGVTGVDNRRLDVAKECADAQGNEGAIMSADAEEMDNIANGMGTPPNCFEDLGAWNGNAARLAFLCGRFNTNNAALSLKCQTDSKAMDCRRYSNDIRSGSPKGLHINPCDRPTGTAAFVNFMLMLLLLIVVIAIGVLLGPFAALIAALVFLALGSYFIGLGGGGHTDDVSTHAEDGLQDSSVLESSSTFNIQ